MVDPDLMIHPGEVLLEEFLEPHKLAPSRLADHLGLPANRITRIVRGQTGVSSEMAVLLGETFGTTAEFWLNLQSRYDLERARSGLSAEAVERARRLHKQLEAA
jgi:antitoxin HigA-1